MKRTKKYIPRIAATAGVIATAVTAVAGPISRQQAEAAARNFLIRETGIFSTRLKSVSLHPALISNGKTTSKSKRQNNSSAPDSTLYAFNAEGGGFVIVSGDDRAVPILGYSRSGNIDPISLPPALQEWLKLNSIYVAAAAKSGQAAAIQQSVKAGTVVKGPLLGKISWGQDEPFNDLCPTYTSQGTTKHYYTGCVAAAATQIMDYYKYPARGTGKASYTFKGQTLSADFGSTSYDWASMPDIVSSTTPGAGNVASVTTVQRQALSTLAYHFGVAVEMEYNETGSGAYTQLVPGALRSYFGYDPAATMRKRDYYSSAEWLSMIKAEIDAGRPVYYGATSDVSTAGHAFVCDGYDSEGFVHINWGWYGRSNGYFLVNHLNPSELGEGGGTGGYNTDQEIVTGIRPAGQGTGTLEYQRPLYGSVRLSCTDYGADFTLMTFISNYDTTPFEGEVAAAVTRGGKVLAILAGDGKPTPVPAFENGKSGFASLTMRKIPKTVDSAKVADGECEVRLVFRESASSPWQYLRHGHGDQAFVEAEAKGGQITIEPEAKPHPAVTVIGTPTTDGEVFAKGSLVLNLSLRNETSNFNLKNLVVRFESTDGSQRHWDYENRVNIYDGATENLSLLVNLTDDMPAGRYKLQFFEKEYEEWPFAVDTTPEVTVGKAAEGPVMRLTAKPLWGNRDGKQEAVQGEPLLISATARNYGKAGKVGAIAWLTDKDNAEKKYMFLQSDATVAQGASATFNFYRTLPVDPGTYNVELTYIDEAGTIVADPGMDSYAETITVAQPHDGTTFDIARLSLPAEMVKGEKYPCSITLKSNKAFRGMLYLRLRQFTLKNGEIMTMKSISMSEGQNLTVDFSYRPGVDLGRYVLLVEGKQGGEQVSVGGYNDHFAIINVTDTPSGISHGATASSVAAAYSNGRLYVSGGSVGVKAVEVFDASGRKVSASAAGADSPAGASLSLPRGVYVVAVTTDGGVVSKKIIVD